MATSRSQISSSVTGSQSTGVRSRGKVQKKKKKKDKKDKKKNKKDAARENLDQDRFNKMHDRGKSVMKVVKYAVRK